MAITSTGRWFASLLSRTNNSDTFVDFIKLMVKWIICDTDIPIKEMVLTLDNSQVHKSERSLKILNQINCPVIFIPPI